MPAKDIYHHTVKNALIKDGWTITNDPLSLKIGKKDIYIDLAAEKILVAEKQGQKIAVEVKSFVASSEIEDLKNALGQYILYDKVLKRQLSERLLYLAIIEVIFNRLFTEEIGQILLEDNTLKIMVFEPEKEVIIKWINYKTIAKLFVKP
ncbi:XisH family protein [Moorena sp. SIO3I6]|uniref:XisH family protein n=1 Tax=Moorena sp. SIO3I6 TaxID=2607831 RepID=UPI0013FC58F9|nr:XisH family protein [Moorena sp. SIO3I6]NEP26362.1 fatty-acid synthase [Moorena sp. SIO3I6]